MRRTGTPAGQWKLSSEDAGPVSRRAVTLRKHETQLTIPEGVLLGHALVAGVADSLGIRVFFIKGPASVFQGLRQAKMSSDVDVFVDPSKLNGLLEGLRGRGWRKRPVDPDNRTFPKHSVTVHHPEWPCCIDIHYRFPGMENPAADCFEFLWGNTVRLVLAGQEVRVHSNASGILILALHALRSPGGAAYREELDYLSRFTQRQQTTAAAVLDVAVATGSLAAVRPFLEDLLDGSIAPVWPEPSLEWRTRRAARAPGSARLIALARASWKDKPRMAWRAIFPQREAFLNRDIYADMSVIGLLNQHRARWGRFLRALPRLSRELRGL